VGEKRLAADEMVEPGVEAIYTGKTSGQPIEAAPVAERARLQQKHGSFGGPCSVERVAAVLAAVKEKGER